MKTAAVVLAAVAIKAVAGQAIKDFFPECAVKCIEASLPAAKECATGDTFCLCRHSNYEDVYLDAYDCVVDACGFDKAEGEFFLPYSFLHCNTPSLQLLFFMTLANDT